MFPGIMSISGLFTGAGGIIDITNAQKQNQHSCTNTNTHKHTNINTHKNYKLWIVKVKKIDFLKTKCL